MSCSTCGYNQPSPEAQEASQIPSVTEKFCRRCGSRLQETRQKDTIDPSQVQSLPTRPAYLVSRRGETRVMLIAAMWVLTFAAWVSVLAMEPMIGVALDLFAVVLALVLIILPSTTNRINGWAKIGSEAAALVPLLWHRV